MKRSFTILTAAIALLSFLAIPMGMMGQTRDVETFTFSEMGYSNAADVTTVVGDDVTLTFDAGTNASNSPKYYNTGAGVRMYAGNTLEVALNDQTGDTRITAIDFTFSGSSYTGGLQNWTGSETSHTFTATGTARIQVIAVTFADGGTPQPTTYTVTFDAGEGTFVGSIDFPNASNTIEAGSYTLPSAERSGYIFNGWALGEDIYEGGASYTVSSDADFVASYTENGGGSALTALLNIESYADANGWTNGTKYTEAIVSPVTFTANGGSNTGKYYTTGEEWRYYQTESASITISIAEGYTLTSITPTYNVSNNGVLKNGSTSITSGTTVNVSGTSVTFTVGNSGSASNGQVKFTNIDVTYVSDGGTLAPSILADNVNIAYDAEEGTINYTINNPVNGGSITASCDAEWIEVDDTPQTSSTGSIDFICYPNSNFYAHSATVTLTYTYSDSKATVTKDVTVTQALDPDANGSTAEYPIMVSEAIEAIDEVSNVSNIYVVGIVSEIVEEYNSTYGNITFDMIDEEGNEYFLRAYRCGGDEAANVMVGDEAVVYGNLYKYNNLIYEFASGCQLVSLTHPVVPAITVDPSTVEATAAETEGTLNVTYTAIETSLGASIYWYTDNTGTTTTDEPNWISADVDETTLNVDYVIAENNGEARTAYLKVYGVDEELNDVYSDLVTINQAGALQQYTLTVEPFENLELITFVNDEMVMEGDGDIQVNEGDHIMLSIVADEGYVMETLMVNSVNHVNDIAADFTYEFDMPAEDVTISATAVEDVAPVSSDYVRITSLDQLTDGSIVVIAARYDEEHTNGYYAMTNATSGKPTGVLFTSTTSGDNEILPASIAENEDNYYWVVNETENGYTFTNAEGFLIGYTSSTNFATGGNNTEWTINSITASSTSMVPNYAGFKIVNVNQNGRAFALNESHNYAPYSTSNLNGSDAYKYNFSLDFFVQSEAPVTETYTLEITGYEEGSNGGYYLIASPVTVDPATVDGMTSGDFDLYYYDESNDNEWRNYEANAFNLEPGKGYLYAKQATTEGEVFNFTLTGTPYAGNGTVELDYNEDSEFPGFNLIGNPFGTNATLNMPYYRLNSDRSGLNTSTENTEINVMEGVFVQATAEIQTATFSTGAKRVNQLNIKVTRNRGTVLDNAIIRFDNGATLGKFQLNQNSTKLYITEGNQDYAIVRSTNVGEMPVSFKAAENGNYTLSVDVENVEVSYLHLIDNMNNADIDLLATPSYSFDARTTDNANRFRLVFNTNGVDENTTTASFAYFNGSEWTISNMGEATLQVVDMMGRVLSTQAISGNTEVSISQVPGVYMLRLINGENVMVQKVVVR